MYSRVAVFALLILPWLAARAAEDVKPDNMQVCRTRQVELGRKAAEFKGDDRMRRLIEADLRRASREETEGDDDECIEALDHAAKLLAGDA